VRVTDAGGRTVGVALQRGPGQGVGQMGTPIVGATPSPSGLPPASPKLPIVEPPPLEEWLKGRNILTVAQDGSGQFNTIQAALDALKPGEAVQVLDQGPYRESINLTSPPEDVGLISHRQTVLEIADWTTVVERNSQIARREGHRILYARGFRLSGFAIHAAANFTESPLALNFEGSSKLTIEDCKFQIAYVGPPQGEAVWAIRINGFGVDENSPTVVRDCVLAGGIGVIAWDGRAAAPLLVLRNFILSPPPGLRHTIAVTGAHRRIFVRNNVMACEPRATALSISHSGAITPEVVEIADNTIVGAGYTIMQFTAPESGVTITGNVLPAFVLCAGAETNRAAIKNWRIAGNWYPVRPEDLPNAQDLVFRRPDDPLVDVRFLSRDQSATNFARLAVVPDHAPAGALAPGPAPAGGDWFTRLRARWP
jgi:hypothetical protein